MTISKLSDDLVKGGIKEIFPLEEKNMSPFIADNISDFEEIIGKKLGEVTREKSVGRYEADIVANFADEEGCLIIENKIGQFDHDHLGKALTYMSYLNGKTIIWICDKYYDEHVKAINYLNDITTEEFSFYAIELQLYKIGDNVKYKYNIVAKPDYQVKQLFTSKEIEDTPVKKANKEFYNEFVKILANNNITFIPEPRGLGYGWIKNAPKNIGIMCNIHSRKKEITFTIESLIESEIDNLLAKFDNKYEFEKTYGKRNNTLVRLTYKNMIIYNERPIEKVKEAANEFIEILNYINS